VVLPGGVDAGVLGIERWLVMLVSIESDWLPGNAAMLLLQDS
jgi:hypothetical protein